MDDKVTDADRIDALLRIQALDRARQLVLKHLDAAEPPLTPLGTSSVIDARWDGHLRMVSNIALAHLDPSDPDQASQMRELAKAVATLATASGSDGPSSLAQPAVRLRLHIERLAAGADDVGFEPPVAVPALTTDPEPDLDPYEELFGPDPTQTVEWTRSSVFLARPRLVRSGRNTKPHGLSWLPQAVQVNDHEFEVYVESAWPASQAATSGIPSARMFLVGHLDPSPTPTAHEVRIRVARYSAVDVPATGVEPPAALRREVCANDAYVLPAAWLDRCHVVLDDGEFDNGEIGSATAATMWCSGAAHGIDGLPDIETASPRVFGRSVRAYALVPEVGNVVGFVRLYRRPPRSARGRLVELRVGHRRVIDLVRLSARLAALSAVRTILPDLHAQGARLILPHGEFERALATRVFAADGDRWQPQPVRRGMTLAGLIAAASEPLSAAP